MSKSVRELTKEEVSLFEKNQNYGDLDLIEVVEDFSFEDNEILSTNFRGKNTLGNGIHLIGSILSDVAIDTDSWVVKSTVINSIIGAGTVIESNSVVKDSVCSPIVVPVKQDDGSHKEEAFFVLINNSQVDGDVIFGGTDLRKTKSRGGSVFAFAHLGEGEFTKNIIFGSQPDAESSKKIVNIAHFGYYGKMILSGVGVYDRNMRVPNVNSHFFTESYSEAYMNLFFGKTVGNSSRFETGRVNIGSGGSMSDYNSISDTKAGAIILLADTGVNVSIPPYMTMLYHSLLGSGSVDVTKDIKDGVINAGSLIATTRKNSFMIENYIRPDRKYVILNDRCKFEMEFVLRYLNMIKAFVDVAKTGVEEKDGIQCIAWKRSLEIFAGISKSVNNRWLKGYFKILEDKSIPGLYSRIEKLDFEKKEMEKIAKLKAKLKIQEELLANKAHFLDEGDEVNDYIADLVSKNPVNSKNMLNIFKKTGKGFKVRFAGEQKHQLKTSIIRVKDEIKL